jgi:hypothetical protein
MGKLAKKKARGSMRMDPIRGGAAQNMGVPPMGAASEAETEETTSQIVCELSSLSPEQRAKAAHAVAAVAATGMVGLKTLERKGVVSRLTRLLCDPSIDVRAAAAAALRNAGLRGGDAVYSAIVQADVMTPLLASLAEMGSALASGISPQDKSTAEAMCVLLDLLWEICESSSAAVDRFNKAGPGCLPLLVQLSTPVCASRYPAVASSSAQCLHVLSEDNQVVIDALQQPNALSSLFSIVADPATSPLVGVLISGTVINIGSACRTPEFMAAIVR